MIKTYHNGININSSLPIPIKLAIKDLENTLGRTLSYQWTLEYNSMIQLTIEDKGLRFRIDTVSQEDVFLMLYEMFKVNKDTWDESLYNSEIAQAFHDAAADWAYIV